MAWVETRIPRTTQPQDACGIDWNNPLTRQLAFAWSAADPKREASKGITADTNNTTRIASVKGLAAKSSAGQTNLEWNREFISTSNGTGTGDFTMVVFANPSASGATVEHVLSQKNDAGGSPFNQVSFIAHVNSSGSFSSGSFSFFLYPASGSGSVVASASACDGSYHMWIGRRIGNGLSLFKDGLLIGSGTEAAITNITQSPARRTAIGSRGNGTTESYTQSAAFSASFNRALSDAEIKSLSDNPWQIFEPERQTLWIDDATEVAPPGDTTVTTDASASYSVAGSVQADSAASYKIASTVTQDATAAYAVRSSATADVAASYKIVSTVQQDASAQYAIRAAVTADASASYSLIAASSVTADASASYVVRGAVQQDASASYAVRAAVFADAVASYALIVDGQVTADASASYQIRGAVQSDASLAYEIAGAVQASASAGYVVQGMASADASAAYVVRGAVVVDAVGSYLVDGEYVPSTTAGAQTRPSRLQSSSRPSRIQTGTRASR